VKKSNLVLALVAALALTGCRSIFLGGKQDVIISGPPGETIMVDGTPAVPGPFKLDRSRDHIISTPSGWTTTVESRFASVEFVGFFLFLAGPFELIDFTNGTAYYLDPQIVNVPPQVKR
jgi:hypothetical protein